MELRAFSVKQPWAGLLMAGVKRFEVRTWRPQGRIRYALVHASSGKAPGMPELRKEQLYREAVRQAEMSDESRWPRSALLGLVEIERVWEPNDVPPGLSESDIFLCGAVSDLFLWEVGGRWPFPAPIECHGKLNLWRVAEDLHERVNAQLSAAKAPVRIGAE